MKKKYYLFKMNMNFLNVFSVVLILLSCGIFYIIYQDASLAICHDIYLPFIFLYVPYLILHELFHSLGYVIYGANFKNITYGMHLEKGVLCCLCKQNINKRNILFSLLYPFFFLGVLTLAIGIIINSPLLILLSLANISGCSGDLVMFYHLRRLDNFEFSEYDDPTSFGLYTKNDLSNVKMFGLDYVDSKSKLERNNSQKIIISKMSIIILLLFYALIVLSIVL